MNWKLKIHSLSHKKLNGQDQELFYWFWYSNSYQADQNVGARRTVVPAPPGFGYEKG
jgi:hypothetical protein